MTEIEASAARAGWVIGGIALAGGLIGAAVGGGLFAAYGLITEATQGGGGFDWSVVPAAAVGGALVGGIGFPALAWSMFRDVGLGRLVRALAGGAIIGGILGLASLALDPTQLLFPIGGAPLGMLVAAVTLRLRKNRHAEVGPIA